MEWDGFHFSRCLTPEPRSWRRKSPFACLSMYLESSLSLRLLKNETNLLISREKTNNYLFKFVNTYMGNCLFKTSIFQGTHFTKYIFFC